MSKPNSTDSGRHPLIMNIRNILQRTKNFVAFLYLTVIFSMYLRVLFLYMPAVYLYMMSVNLYMDRVCGYVFRVCK